MLALNHTASGFTNRCTLVVMLSFHMHLPEMVFSATRDKQIPGTPVDTWRVYPSRKSCGMYKQSGKAICDNALVQVEFL